MGQNESLVICPVKLNCGRCHNWNKDVLLALLDGKEIAPHWIEKQKSQHGGLQAMV
jgi:hypothetical protein